MVHGSLTGPAGRLKSNESRYLIFVERLGKFLAHKQPLLERGDALRVNFA